MASIASESFVLALLFALIKTEQTQRLVPLPPQIHVNSFKLESYSLGEILAAGTGEGVALRSTQRIEGIKALWVQPG